MDPKSKRMEKAKAKGPHGSEKKFDAKLVAIALIFAMLFVSYVVIFTSQEPARKSKNMVFENDDPEKGIYIGNVKNLDLNLTNVNLTIKDSSSDSVNSTEKLTTGFTLTTEGDFNCTFIDKNDNGMLDKNDEFKVYNASPEDKIELREIDSDELVAYYIFP